MKAIVISPCSWMYSIDTLRLVPGDIDSDECTGLQPMSDKLVKMGLGLVVFLTGVAYLLGHFLLVIRYQP